MPWYWSLQGLKRESRCCCRCACRSPGCQLKAPLLLVAVTVAAAGFRTIAPGFRGYGLPDQPPEPEKATWKDLIDDLLAILDYLSIPKAFIVTKDFGAFPAYSFALNYPDRVSGVVTLGIPFVPGEKLTFMELPEGYYLSRWRMPRRAEADFGGLDVKTVVKNIYILFSASEFLNAKKDEEIMDLVDPSALRPSVWL